jgi:hypothetical protein
MRVCRGDCRSPAFAEDKLRGNDRGLDASSRVAPALRRHVAIPQTRDRRVVVQFDVEAALCRQLAR